jgi:Xaa-Pro dipeptidase
MLLADLKNRPEAKVVNWAKVEQLMPYGGVRIEDEVHCTEDEPENISRDAFAAL